MGVVSCFGCEFYGVLINFGFEIVMVSLEIDVGSMEVCVEKGE